MLISENRKSALPRRDRSEGEFVLAVDSGGTKTLCTLARIDQDKQWSILGTGRAEAGNPRAIGLDKSAQTIAHSVRLAKAEAGLDSFPCHRALFAVAGTLHAPIRDELCEQLRRLELAEECFVIPDLIPLLAGCGKHVSIGLISGTGSVGIGRDPTGKYAIAGGWGPLLGDDGSGFSIGRAVLRASLRQLEVGQTAHGLVDTVCKTLQASTSLDVKAVIANAIESRDLVASLAPVVLAAAQDNDPLGQEIVTAAAVDLADIIQTLMNRLAISPDGQVIALSGGILRADSPLTEELAKELAGRGFAVKLDVIDDPISPILNMLAQPELSSEFEILP